ncbi:hypothetical protein [Rhodococcus qingshengii]|nr:hypothetical protein [Rhodococcus qingshengii]
MTSSRLLLGNAFLRFPVGAFASTYRGMKVVWPLPIVIVKRA